MKWLSFKKDPGPRPKFLCIIGCGAFVPHTLTKKILDDHDICCPKCGNNIFDKNANIGLDELSLALGKQCPAPDKMTPHND